MTQSIQLYSLVEKIQRTNSSGGRFAQESPGIFGHPDKSTTKFIVALTRMNQIFSQAAVDPSQKLPELIQGLRMIYTQVEKDFVRWENKTGFFHWIKWIWFGGSVERAKLVFQNTINSKIVEVMDCRLTQGFSSLSQGEQKLRGELADAREKIEELQKTPKDEKELRQRLEQAEGKQAEAEKSLTQRTSELGIAQAQIEELKKTAKQAAEKEKELGRNLEQAKGKEGEAERTIIQRTGDLNLALAKIKELERAAREAAEKEKDLCKKLEESQKSRSETEKALEQRNAELIQAQAKIDAFQKNPSLEKTLERSKSAKQKDTSPVSEKEKPHSLQQTPDQQQERKRALDRLDKALHGVKQEEQRSPVTYPRPFEKLKEESLPGDAGVSYPDSSSEEESPTSTPSFHPREPVPGYLKELGILYDLADTASPDVDPETVPTQNDEKEVVSARLASVSEYFEKLQKKLSDLRQAAPLENISSETNPPQQDPLEKAKILDSSNNSEPVPEFTHEEMAELLSTLMDAAPKNESLRLLQEQLDKIEYDYELKAFYPQLMALLKPEFLSVDSKLMDAIRSFIRSHYHSRIFSTWNIKSIRGRLYPVYKILAEALSTYLSSQSQNWSKDQLYRLDKDLEVSEANLEAVADYINGGYVLDKNLETNANLYSLADYLGMPLLKQCCIKNMECKTLASFKTVSSLAIKHNDRALKIKCLEFLKPDTQLPANLPPEFLKLCTLYQKILKSKGYITFKLEGKFQSVWVKSFSYPSFSHAELNGIQKNYMQDAFEICRELDIEEVKWEDPEREMTLDLKPQLKKIKSFSKTCYQVLPTDNTLVELLASGMLTNLDLISVSFTKESAEKFFHTLATNGSLKSLDIAMSNICNIYCDLLIEALKKNQTLEYVKLDVPPTVGYTMKLIDALNENKSLKAVYFSLFSGNKTEFIKKLSEKLVNRASPLEICVGDHRFNTLMGKGTVTEIEYAK